MEAQEGTGLIQGHSYYTAELGLQLGPTLG